MSSVAWTGDTRFEGNSARNGGAVHVSGTSCPIAWSGETTFEGNFVSGSGGGLFVGEGAEVNMTGRTDFSNNHADVNGGAVVSALNSVTDATESIISIDGITSFFNNSCQSCGGALMISGSVSLSFASDGTQFLQNVAESAGGAVCLTGVGEGPTFGGILFDSNSAQIGGAVRSTGSGTTILATGEEFPVTYTSCNFTGNWATASGGAMESAAGKDLVVNSTFLGNTASQGGAARFAGSLSVSNCLFMNNHADEQGGPAMSNVGFMEGIEACTFADNDVLCPSGTFLDFVDGDRYSDVCSGCEECSDCDVADSSEVPTCTITPDHAQSTGNTIETLSVDRGYWRATPSSRNILACHNGDACLGGETGAADYCAEGYEGSYCAVCSDGFAESLSFTCSSCSDGKATVVALVALPIMVILGLIFLVYMVSKERERERDAPPAGPWHRLKQLLPLQSLKIMIVVWQILTELASVATVSFPDAYEQFLDGTAFLGFDFGWMLSAGCFVDIDFHDRVVTSTVGPLVALAILGLTYIVARCRNRSCDQALQKVRWKHVSMALWVSFLVYSPVSSTIFQTFSCETLDDGKTYLRVDYRIDCDSSKHLAMEIYAGLMIFVYPIGIPLVYAALLFWGRDALKIAAVPNMEQSRVQAAVHLSSPYRPGCFYYEVIECARRVLLTGVIVFIFPNESGQIAVTLVMACTFALLFEALAPYDSKWDAWISRSGHVIVLLSIFVAFLLEQRVTDGTSESQDFYGGVLLGMNVSMVSAVVVQGIIMACSATRPTESLLPRSVTSAAVGFDVEHSSSEFDEHGGSRIASTARTQDSESFRSAVEDFSGIVSRRGTSFRQR
ncbi:unnamed protein product [Ectocarpus sp. 12 AP-2014]